MAGLFEDLNEMELELEASHEKNSHLSQKVDDLSRRLKRCEDNVARQESELLGGDPGQGSSGKLFDNHFHINRMQH